MSYNIRRSYARDQLRKQMIAREEPCHICGRAINYSLSAGEPMSFEMDEVVPVSRLPLEQRRAAACDPENVKAAHRICNQKRGNRMMNELKGNALPIVRTRLW